MVDGCDSICSIHFDLVSPTAQPDTLTCPHPLPYVPALGFLCSSPHWPAPPPRIKQSRAPPHPLLPHHPSHPPSRPSTSRLLHPHANLKVCRARPSIPPRASRPMLTWYSQSNPLSHQPTNRHQSYHAHHAFREEGCPLWRRQHWPWLRRRIVSTTRPPHRCLR